MNFDQGRNEYTCFTSLLELGFQFKFRIPEIMKSRTNLRRQREILPSEKWIDLDKILEPRRRTKL
jgi:hypothetical protein